MKRFVLATIFLVLLTVDASAHAQAGIYAKLDLQHFNNQNNKTTNWFYGPSFGMYYDFIHLGPLHVGGDLRGSVQWGSSISYHDVLVGARVAIKPPVLPIKPYAQISAGMGATKANSPTLSTSYINKFQYRPIVGVDVTILPRIDFRMVEVEFGTMSGVGSGPIVLDSKIVTVSTGLVFRLP